MEKMLGGDLNNANIYDDQTLYDIFGEEEMREIRRTGRLPDVMTDKQRLSLAGEAFLKQNNFKYDDKNWKINGSSDNFTFTQHLADNVKGSLVANSIITKNTDGSLNMSNYNVDTGGFNFFTVFEEVERHPLSYTLYNGSVNAMGNNAPNRFLDTRTVSIYDLDGNQKDSYVSTGWITVQTQMGVNPKYGTKDFVNMLIAGNPIKVGPETIAEGYIAYQIQRENRPSNTINGILNGELYLQAVYGTTINGTSIQSNGQADLSDGRHLLHPAEIGYNSGCGVTNKNNFTKYTDKLNNTWNIPVGAVVFGNISQKYIPGINVRKRGW